MLKEIKKQNKGITLIALIVAIIVLIILSGVTIRIILGRSGIIEKAKESGGEYEQASAKEKLELVLVDARIEKDENPNYNNQGFLTQMLERNNLIVNENVVIVDNHNFIIDREKLVILESLGESQIKVTTEVQEYLGKNENDKYEARMLLAVESITGLQSVSIQNPDKTTYDIEVEQVKLGKDIEVELDEEYILNVTTGDGTTETRKIGEKSEEYIRTEEELVKFRDKVNQGLTYEGKTITLMKDMDLSKICYKEDGTVDNDVSWEPIGNVTAQFSGIFDGNYYTINNLYINKSISSSGDFGLFGQCNGATIKNLQMKNGSINIQNDSTENTYVRSNSWFF